MIWSRDGLGLLKTPSCFPGVSHVHPGGKPQGPSRGYTRGEGPVHGPVHVLELNVAVAVVLVESVSQELSSRATGQWAS